MDTQNTSRQLRYLEEVRIPLHRAGFETLPLEGEQLPVLWNGAPLCRITGKGSVFYRRKDADTPHAEDALYHVEDIAAKTLEYMTAMEAAPQLKASGLDGGCRILADFGGRMFRPLQRRLRDELNRQPFRFFLGDAHRERWTHWKNRCYGMSERNAAALFLLTADEELWQRVLWHFDSSGFDFSAIRLSGIHPELYSIYQAAKTISVGGDNIVIEDLAFSELVSDRAFRLILGALLLCRYGEVVLNLERKTEEAT